MARLPSLFITHGGGPCFWMEFGPPFGPHAFDKLRAYLAGLIAGLPERPKAILMISGHWEEERPTVSTAAKPGMLFDYSGFPEHTYQLNYPGARRAGSRRARPRFAARGEDRLRHRRRARL